MDPTFRDRAVLLGETLVCADLHVGRADASNVAYPLGERADLTDRLGALLDCLDPAEVVFAGDVLHSFDSVPAAAEGTVAALQRTVREAGAGLVVVPGNHDAMLGSVQSGPCPAEYAIGDDVVVCHGHAEPETPAEAYVVGHDHPAIAIEGKKWPCYLRGAGVYGGADVLVLPAFSPLVGGVAVNGRSGGGWSPLVTDLDAFRPVVRDEEAGETREFPPLGELREFL